MVKYPNYDNSILSVTSSVLKYYGVKTNHCTNNMADEALSHNPRNVILFVLDGMGDDMMSFLPEWTFFKRNHRDTISSVFPPTTSAATITLKTGLTPAEHGRLGMFLYYDAVKRNEDSERSELMNGNIIAGIRQADEYLPVKTIFTSIEEASEDVKAIEISQFSQYKCMSMDDICENALKIADSSGRHFMYCYWDQPDRDAHMYGSKSSNVRWDIISFNLKIRKLAQKLPQDSVLVVTADHGLKDTKWIRIEDYPLITDMLERRPTVERRAVSFKVKNGMNEQFEKEFRSKFSDKFMLMSYDEIIEKRLLGEGNLNEKCRAFIGDYMAVAFDDYSITLTDEDSRMKSCHAGLTDSEIDVPLIIFKK